LTSISIPAISSGIYGFPKDLCAKILFECAINYFKDNPKSSLKEVRFVNFDDNTVEYFENEFINKFGGKKKEKNITNFDNLSEEDLLKFVLEQSKNESQGQLDLKKVLLNVNLKLKMVK